MTQEYELNTTKTYYRDNPSLKRPGIKYEFTQEEYEEYLKCASDPVYFIRNYMYIISLDEGLVKFDLYPYQEDMVNTFKDNRFVICKLPRQVGKCLSINTNIKVRNKKTGELRLISIGDLHELSKHEMD